MVVAEGEAVTDTCKACIVEVQALTPDAGGSLPEVVGGESCGCAWGFNDYNLIVRGVGFGTRFDGDPEVSVVRSIKKADVLIKVLEVLEFTLLESEAPLDVLQRSGAVTLDFNLAIECLIEGDVDNAALYLLRFDVGLAGNESQLIVVVVDLPYNLVDVINCDFSVEVWLHYLLEDLGGDDY